MTSPQLRLDWDKQLAIFENYALGERGAAVHVRVSDSAPVGIFIKVLRDVLAQSLSGKAWRLVIVNPDDYQTTLFLDIVRTIGAKCGIDLPGLSASGTFFSNWNSGGAPISVSGVSMSLPRASESELVDALIAGMRAGCEQFRFVVVFQDTHKYPRELLEKLARELWVDRLARLVQTHGVLLIDLSNTTDDGFPSDVWPPGVDHTVQLNAEFTPEEIELAIAHLASTFERTRLAGSETLARQLVNRYAPNVGRIYAGVAPFVAQQNLVQGEVGNA